MGALLGVRDENVRKLSPEDVPSAEGARHDPGGEGRPRHLLSFALVGLLGHLEGLPRCQGGRGHAFAGQGRDEDHRRRRRREESGPRRLRSDSHAAVHRRARTTTTISRGARRAWKVRDDRQIRERGAARSTLETPRPRSVIFSLSPVGGARSCGGRVLRPSVERERESPALLLENSGLKS